MDKKDTEQQLIEEDYEQEALELEERLRTAVKAGDLNITR